MVLVLKRAVASSSKERVAAESRLVRIFVGTVTVGGISSAVKIISIVKGAVIARQFGINPDLDAFYIALLMPSFICDLFASVTLIAFVPLYVRTREQDGPESAQRLLASATLGATIILTVGSIILWMMSPHFIPLLATSFHPRQIAQTQSFFLYLVPLMPLSGLSAIFTAVVTARDRLALATVAPVISTVVVIISVYGFAARWGTYAIAVGMTLGLGLQVIILMIGLRYFGLCPTFEWGGFTPQVRSFLRQSITVAIGASVMNLVDVIDQYSAASIGPGSVSALNYGNKVVVMVVGLASVAVTTAALPHLSALVSANDFSGAIQIVKTYSLVILVVTIPVAFFLILLSPYIVTVLFEGRAFTHDDTLQVAAIQRFFLLQIPPHVLGMLFVSLVWAMRANWVFLLINPVCLIFKIFLNNALIVVYGVTGIGLATSITYGLSCVFLLLAITKLIQREAQPAA